MLLAIDIGNTNVTFGVFEGEKIKTTWRVSTAIHRTPDEYAHLMLSLMERQGVTAAQIKDVVICSVVPPLLIIFEEVCKRFLKKAPLIVEAGVKTGVRIDMDNPREVGPDRIVNAVAAHQLYGGPVIVIDMGTATTIDVVSKDGRYIGGRHRPGYCHRHRSALHPHRRAAQDRAGAAQEGHRQEHGCCHAVRHRLRLHRPDRRPRIPHTGRTG